MGKITWSSYVGGRLGGCEERALEPGERGAVGGTERDRFPQFFAEFIDCHDYFTARSISERSMSDAGPESHGAILVGW